jgi:Domain of unknown function (DUF6456)
MSAAARAESQTTVLDQLRQRMDGAGRPWIGPAAHLAGERFAADLIFAGMLPKTTMDWSRGAPSDRGAVRSGLNATEAAVAARQRADSALRAVGPDFAGVLMDVCGFDKGLETLERERNWPVRSAKVVVRFALDALARHYGYADAAEGRASRRSEVWTAPGTKCCVQA